MLFQRALISGPNSQTNIPDNHWHYLPIEETEVTLVCFIEEEAKDALSWGAHEA